MHRRGRTATWWRWLRVPWSEATMAATIVAAAAMPVFLVASADVWRATSEDDISVRALESAPLDRNGLDVAHETNFEPVGVENADARITVAIDRLPGVGAVDRTLYTFPGLASIGPPVRQVGPQVRIMARTGAIDAVDVVEQLDDTTNGVWVTTWYADRHGLELGDGLAFEAGAIADEEWNDIVQGGGAASVFRIVGFYRPLWSEESDVELDPYWAAVPPEVVPRYISAFNGPNTELVITTEQTLLGSRLTGVVRWRAPLSETPGSFDGLRRVRDQVRAFATAIAGRGALGTSLDDISTAAGGRPRLTTDLFETTSDVERAASRLTGPMGSARAVGATVGLLGMIAVGLFFVERRRSEFRLLAGEGERAPVTAARVAAQLVAPVGVGACAGVLAAVEGLWLFGPADRAEFGDVDPVPVVVITAAALLLASGAAGLAGSRTLRTVEPGARRTIVRVLAAALLAATVFTWVQIGRTAGAGATEVDVAVVVLPVLAMVLAVGVAMSLAGLVIGLLGPVSESLPVAGFLAMRRLAGGSSGLRTVAGAIGLGVGLLVFAVALTSTLDHTVEVKLSTEIGAESMITLVDEPLAGDLLPTRTTILRNQDTEITPDSVRTRVVAIDESTWAQVVDWPSSFGSNPSDIVDLLRRRPDTPLPVVRITGEPVASSGSFGLVTAYPYRVVAEVGAFPGAGANTATILVSAQALDELALELEGYDTIADAEEANFELPTHRMRRMAVSQAPLDELTAAADVAGLRFRDPVSRTERGRRPAVLANRAAFGYLGVLGIASAVSALVALGLQLAARRRVRALDGVMVRSMGLSPGRAAAVTLIEFATVLSIAVASAFVAVPLVVRHLSSRFDPEPSLPPDVVVSVDWLRLVVIAAVSVTLVGAGVWWVDFRAGRRSAGEVLRDAG